ncbi:MAG: keywimysin-related RiPP [Brevibacterium aurantiacum]
MAKVYEAPALVELGNFRQDTGELFGPHTEAVLLFWDFSDEG